MNYLCVVVPETEAQASCLVEHATWQEQESARVALADAHGPSDGLITSLCVPGVGDQVSQRNKCQSQQLPR